MIASGSDGGVVNVGFMKKLMLKSKIIRRREFSGFEVDSGHSRIHVGPLSEPRQPKSGEVRQKLPASTSRPYVTRN